MKPWKLMDRYTDWCYIRFGKKKGFLLAITPYWAILLIYTVLLFSGVFGEN